MSAFRFKNVVLAGIARSVAPIEVTSAELEDRVAPLYERLGIPFGTLEKLSGIRTRRFWEGSFLPSQISTEAANQLLDNTGFKREDIGVIINCSVTRDYFEPATATLVHRNLGLSNSCMGFDVTNACIGFSNGIVLLSNMIESGVVKAGLLISGENVSYIVESCAKHLATAKEITREDLIKILPVFTLGCGGVAAVLCHEKYAKDGHKIIGSICHTASEHNDLCNGNGDYCATQMEGLSPIMYTESSELIASAAKLGAKTWVEFSETFGWNKDSIDHIFCHQVGRQVNDAFYKEIGLDLAKEFTVYKSLGNMVSAALPTALAVGAEEKPLKKGDKALLLGYGSGLNSIFTGIEW